MFSSFSNSGYKPLIGSSQIFSLQVCKLLFYSKSNQVDVLVLGLIDSRRGIQSLEMNSLYGFISKLLEDNICLFQKMLIS